MSVMSVTLPVPTTMFHSNGQSVLGAVQPLLKAVAPANMPTMLVTLEVFQPSMFRLNAVAPLNMPAMVLTLLVSQALMF